MRSPDDSAAPRKAQHRQGSAHGQPRTHAITTADRLTRSDSRTISVSTGSPDTIRFRAKSKGGVEVLHGHLSDQIQETRHTVKLCAKRMRNATFSAHAGRQRGDVRAHTERQPPARRGSPCEGARTPRWHSVVILQVCCWLRLLRNSGQAGDLGVLLSTGRTVFPRLSRAAEAVGESIEGVVLGLLALVRLAWAVAAALWRALPGV